MQLNYLILESKLIMTNIESQIETSMHVLDMISSTSSIFETYKYSIKTLIDNIDKCPNKSLEIIKYIMKYSFSYDHHTLYEELDKIDCKHFINIINDIKAPFLSDLSYKEFDYIMDRLFSEINEDNSKHTLSIIKLLPHLENICKYTFTSKIITYKLKSIVNIIKEKGMVK